MCHSIAIQHSANCSSSKAVVSHKRSLCWPASTGLCQEVSVWVWGDLNKQGFLCVTSLLYSIHLELPTARLGWPGRAPSQAVNITQVVVHVGAVNQETVNNNVMQKHYSSKAVARKRAHLVEVISCVQTTVSPSMPICAYVQYVYLGGRKLTLQSPKP